MKLILCANPTEAATYALHQGWALSQWSTVDTLRKTVYDEVHVIPTWHKRPDAVVKKGVLKRYQRDGYIPTSVEQVAVDPWPLPAKPKPALTAEHMLEETSNYAFAADERIAELEGEVERLKEMVRTLSLANEAHRELIVLLESAGAVEETERAFDLDAMKRPELKKIARSKGIHVTSQTDQKLREQIRDAS